MKGYLETGKNRVGVAVIPETVLPAACTVISRLLQHASRRQAHSFTAVMDQASGFGNNFTDIIDILFLIVAESFFNVTHSANTWINNFQERHDWLDTAMFLKHKWQIRITLMAVMA